MKENSKGFTMVELLAAIAILGLLTVMAFPTMRAMQSRNEKQKYEEYGKSMISAAKLYTDSYVDDLFPKGYKNEFAKISTTELLRKDLLKDIGFADVSCIDGNSYIIVSKYGDDFEYCLSMKCKNKSGAIVYQEENKEGICKSFEKKIVTYVSGNNTYEDEIIKGDDAYYALNPSNFPGFNFGTNHQTFNYWKVSGTTDLYKIGDRIDPKYLKGNLELIAETRPFAYKVYYNGNGATAGSVTSPQTCYYGAECKLADANYRKTGSSYTYWKDASGNKYKTSKEYKNLVETDGGEITLSPYWELNKVYILYNVNGGNFIDPYLHDFTIKNNLIYMNNDSKFYYGLYGKKIHENGLVDYHNPKYLNIRKNGLSAEAGREWTTNPDGTGTAYNQMTQYDSSEFCDASNGDCERTVYANWKPKTVTVNFNCNGGTGGGAQSFTYGTPNQSFKNTCSMAGYTVKEWNTRADGKGTSYNTNSGVSNDWINNSTSPVTLYAIWRINIITITYMANGGTMASAHNSSLTIVNDMVHKNGTVPIHQVSYGGIVNLANYNYSGYLNIEKPNYILPADDKEWNTKSDGTGTSYSQFTDYTSEQFCSTIKTGDCNITIYVNWRLKSCSAGKYLKKGSRSCSTCKEGYYCPGGAWPYNNNKSQGIKKCPDGYDNSGSGSSAESNCYKVLPPGYGVPIAKSNHVIHCPHNYHYQHIVHYGQVSECFKHGY